MEDIRKILIELKNSKNIWNFYEIDRKHGWYKENQIQFGLYINEDAFNYDCAIEIKYLKEKGEFEFYSRDHHYGYDKLPFKEMSDLKKYIVKITESTPEVEKLEIDFFAVRSKDGKYFRSVGFSGRSNWVDDIKKAKIYPKISGARGRVTWFAKNYPEFGIPDIIKLTANQAVVLNEAERVTKAIKSKEEKEIKRQKEQAKRKLKVAEDEFIKASRKLNELRDKFHD